MTDEIPFDRSFTQAAGEVVQISPLVRRLVCGNGGPFTFTGTCTYLIGRGDVTVLDPGPADAGHVEAIVRALPGERVAAILVSHTHADHSPAAALLQARTSAPIYGCAQHVAARDLHAGEINRLEASADKTYRPDHILQHGEALNIGGVTLEAVATPGHTMNHLCFALQEENTLFSGDHVMAWSTTIVAPPDGSMGAYMASLELLRGRAEQIYWPGHGGPVNEPQRFVRALLHHRRQREAAILQRLKQGDSSITQIVEKLYAGLDPRLKGAAGLSVFAHLEELIARGEATSGEAPSLTAQFFAV